MRGKTEIKNSWRQKCIKYVRSKWLREEKSLNPLKSVCTFEASRSLHLQSSIVTTLSRDRESHQKLPKDLIQRLVRLKEKGLVKKVTFHLRIYLKYIVNCFQCSVQNVSIHTMFERKKLLNFRIIFNEIVLRALLYFCKQK